MRRGREDGKWKMGGAWQRVAKVSAEKSEPPTHSLEAGATTNATGEADKPCPDESCTKGPCIVGMSLQQS